MEEGVLAAFPHHTSTGCHPVPANLGTHGPSPQEARGMLQSPTHAAAHLASLPSLAGVIRYVALFITLLGTWFIVQTYFERSWKAISVRSWLGGTDKSSSEQLPRHKCRNQQSCPENHFAFKIISGAANVVGPSICFDDMVLMSSVKNNVGRGLNIALVNGTSGQFLKADTFDTYSGDINKLYTFLQEIKHGTIVLMASYDDAATKMNDKVRAYFTELGSSHASNLGFRDNWVFLGAKGLKKKSPFEQVHVPPLPPALGTPILFVAPLELHPTCLQKTWASGVIPHVEPSWKFCHVSNLHCATNLLIHSPFFLFLQHIKNDKDTNKYDGWPELLEMEGCAPRKMD
ncbi:protein FAM3D isoform X1 [Falco cherrug]|uniref:protein FAM3D isoform X1 n=1 Tax=Falco cherrug TaxID=345164 RepID=UPI000FFB067E|nr:protein FAM3D isoform X1 [Falco cherrug]XP_027662100.1 protein FAM3D isoform X1 [Falco cherrug]